MLNPLLALVLLVPAASQSKSLSDLPLVRGATPSETVAVLAAEHPKLLGLGAEDTLDAVRVMRLKRGFVVRAHRLHQGLPVVGESVVVRLDEAGELWRVRTDFTPLPHFSTPRLSPKEAVAAAAGKLYRSRLGESALRVLSLPATLVVEPHRPALAYLVHVPGAAPWLGRAVLIDADTGAILSVKSPVHRAANDAAVYEPSPEPADTLGAPTTVQLARLDANEPLITEGTHASSRSCLTTDDNVRVFTCLDLEEFGGYGCAVPSLRALIAPFCGEGHLAASAGEVGGLIYAPQDDVADYEGDGIFVDPFSEVHGYYHLDLVTEWMGALGHPVAEFPHLPILTNVSIPSSALLSCAREAWAAEEIVSAERAREIVAECVAGGSHYAPMDNAMFLDDSLSAVGITMGLYIGQGETADYAYDGSIIYHEFGHATAYQAEALGGGQVRDSLGLDDSQGALGEAYGDYFAAALSGNPVIGSYVGGRMDRSGLRDLDRNLVCPDYWAGEVHEDSMGFAAALWAVRELYPQTETDEETGMELRVFDRIVYQALVNLTGEAVQKDAVLETLDEIAAEPALEDPTAQLAGDVFEQRNVIDCQRVRRLCTTPIPLISLETRTPNMLAGGDSYDPFAPGPLQLMVEPPHDASSATFEARLESGMTLDALTDLLEETEPPEWDIRLIYRVGEPLRLSYDGESPTDVSIAASDGEVELTATVSGGTTTFRGTLPIPSGAQRIYYVIANYTDQAAVLSEVRIVEEGFICGTPPPAPESPEPGVDPAEGCGCAGAPASFAILGAALLLRRRRSRCS